MQEACTICHRPHRGSLIPKTKTAAKRILLLQLFEEVSCGPCEPDHECVLHNQICIDCRPAFEKELREWLAHYRRKK